MHGRNAFAAALIAISGWAVSANAQTVATSAGVVTSAGNASTRADALHERAARLFESPTQYREAARLLRDAAALRDASDERATDELLLAGRLSYYAGDWSAAQRTFATGGERALENGQLTKAANAYVDAAFTALARRDQDDAFTFVRLAERLADSPHLQRSERNDILGRIGPVRIAVATDIGR